MIRFVSLTLLLMSAPAASAADVPRLDVETTCRAAPALEAGESSSYQACIKDEMDARRQLEQGWATFNVERRKMCFEETHIGGSPSYLDVLTCLQLANGDFTPDMPARRARRDVLK